MALHKVLGRWIVILDATNEALKALNPINSKWEENVLGVCFIGARIHITQNIRSQVAITTSFINLILSSTSSNGFNMHASKNSHAKCLDWHSAKLLVTLSETFCPHHPVHDVEKVEVCWRGGRPPHSIKVRTPFSNLMNDWVGISNWRTRDTVVSVGNDRHRWT